MSWRHRYIKQEARMLRRGASDEELARWSDLIVFGDSLPGFVATFNLTDGCYSGIGLEPGDEHDIIRYMRSKGSIVGETDGHGHVTAPGHPWYML
ncbi:hypothetical protein [Brevibacterium moorei]|uniref:hypothetical protein n=1 Tax=Brevibacterium moorei TaxID=2968457 RepID=UPI00211C3BF1|nr:hypothetical protein [Brevibacterium sp. 68QC2CO]MCQ9385149.1 hypothetical protein [Brevibacterium sp. 68QC2CO]